MYGFEQTDIIESITNEWCWSLRFVLCVRERQLLAGTKGVGAGWVMKGWSFGGVCGLWCGALVMKWGLV